MHLEGGVGVRGRPRRLEAAALVHRDVDQDGPRPHLLDQRVGDQARRPGADDQHGPDDDVGLQADLLDGVLGRGDGLERAAEVVVDLAQPVEVAVEHEDLRMHADGHGGGGEAGHAGPDDNDTGAAHTRHTRHQHAPAAAGPHEVVGSHQRRHAPGHLAHGGQQGQRVVLVAHGLVRDGDVARRHERVRALA